MERRQAMCTSKTEQDLDSFDCLPDALLLLIFNKLQDAKSLTRCLSVSKRFNSLIPFTNTIFISNPPHLHHHLISKPNPTNITGYLRSLVLNLFFKSLRCFHHILPPNSATRSFNTSFYHPNRGVLKNFKEIKALHLELPSHGIHDLGSGRAGASFLKWKAEYGGNLKTCIILGATSFQKCNKFASSEHKSQQQDCMEEILNDDELKLRVIWTISCLIAASRRHHLLKQILADHSIPMLQSLLISDANKQGKFYMGKQHLVEMRDSMISEQEKTDTSMPLMERTTVPELNMKLWYLPRLELPKSGYVMEGATMICISPVDGTMEKKNSDINVGRWLEMKEDSDSDSDGQTCNEAAKEMINKVKRCYLMTMSSF